MVAPAIIGALVGAGLGAANHKNEVAEAQRNRQLQATIARQSPWTSMKADTSNLQNPSMLGDVTKGGLTGATFGMQDALNPKEEKAAPATPKPETPSTEVDPAAVAEGPNSGNGPLQAYQNPATMQAPATLAYLQKPQPLNGRKSTYLAMGN